MSRLLESEQESDSSTSNVTSSTGSLFPYTGFNDIAEAQRPNFNESNRSSSKDGGVKGRLEQFSRRLSQLGLVDTNESSSSEREELITNESRSVGESGREQRNKQTDKVNLRVISGPSKHSNTELSGSEIPGGFNESVPEYLSDKNREPEIQKVRIKFQPIGSIAPMHPNMCLISANKQFSMVINFLKKRLRVESVYCYVNNSFAPVPSQNVGDLWSQFKVNEELIVSYCGTVAFG
ncbi:Atg12p [Nakaseomyces bracarensis]|uniref:Atg12p n=1 Tax=Nakaseomyces bracarensis TaxID=273131 RepID=UPI0038716E47